MLSAFDAPIGTAFRPLNWHIRGAALALVLMTVNVSAQAPPSPPLQPLTVTQLEERPRADDLESTRPLSLSFSEPVPIKDVLLLLVRDSSLSIVPDVDLDGEFIGDLKNVTLRQALETVLQPLSLDYTVQDQVIRVFRRRLVTRIFDLNYVGTRRSGTRVLSTSSGVAGGAVSAIVPPGVAQAGGAGNPGIGSGTLTVVSGSSAQVSGHDESDIFGDIANGLKTVLSAEAKFNVDRKAGLLQVTDYPDRLDKVALYLDAMHARVNQQVLIGAKVIEIELREAFAAGLDWNAIFRRAGNAVSLRQSLAAAAGGVFTMGVDIRDFDALLTAFGTQGKVNVLSSPQVMAMNNEPALMRVGVQDVFFVTTSQVDATTGRLLQTTVTPTPITEGVVLSVTAQVAADGVIQLDISPSVTQRTGQAVSRLGDTVPIISVRETDTLVRVHPGETVVIAGLMQDRVATRALFRRERRITQKTDLVILLTPTLATPGRLMETTAREQERLYELQQAPAKK